MSFPYSVVGWTEIGPPQQYYYSATGRTLRAFYSCNQWIFLLDVHCVPLGCGVHALFHPSLSTRRWWTLVRTLHQGIWKGKIIATIFLCLNGSFPYPRAYIGIQHFHCILRRYQQLAHLEDAGLLNTRFISTFLDCPRIRKWSLYPLFV